MCVWYMSKEEPKPKEFSLTNHRKFPSIPRNQVTKQVPKHHSMNPIPASSLPAIPSRSPDVSFACNNPNLPPNVRRLINALIRKGIMCTSIVRKSTGTYVISTNSGSDYAINANGGIIKINKSKKSRKVKKSRKIRKTRFRK